MKFRDSRGRLAPAGAAEDPVLEKPPVFNERTGRLVWGKTYGVFSLNNHPIEPRPKSAFLGRHARVLRELQPAVPEVDRSELEKLWARKLARPLIPGERSHKGKGKGV